MSIDLGLCLCFYRSADRALHYMHGPKTYTGNGPYLGLGAEFYLYMSPKICCYAPVVSQGSLPPLLTSAIQASNAEIPLLTLFTNIQQDELFITE